MAWFITRAIVWALLVWGCALPVVVVTWPDTWAGRFGEAIGVFVWIVVMVVLDHRSAMLRVGALIVAAVHTALAVVVDPGVLGLFLWFAPAFWIAAKLVLFLGNAPDFLVYLVLTLACGAQSAIVAWLCARAIDGALRALRR